MHSEISLVAVAPALRAAVWEVDERYPTSWVATLDVRINRSMGKERFHAS